MKAKYLRQNIKATKREIKLLAKVYKLKVKLWSSPVNHKMQVQFIYMKPKPYNHLLSCELAEEKIAYGLYKPAMVRYNLERKIISWLKIIK